MRSSTYLESPHDWSKAKQSSQCHQKRHRLFSPKSKPNPEQKRKKNILPALVHVVEQQQHCSITENPQTCEGCAHNPIDVGDEICQLLDLRKQIKQRPHNLTTRLEGEHPTCILFSFYMRHKKRCPPKK